MDDAGQQDYFKRCAGDAIKANLGRAVERLNEAYQTQDQDTRDERVLLVVTNLALRLFAAGVEAGVSELLAQGIEMGLELHLIRSNGPVCPQDGPLDDDWQWDG